MCEVWKDIPGYEGLYQVSNLGRVKSISFRNNQIVKQRDKILTQTKINSGYLTVGFHKDGKQKHCLVHRLVAQAFIQNPENKETVNHINGDKHDNRAINLEWNTPKENTGHSIKTGLNKVCIKNNIKSIPVLQYDLKMNLIATYPSTKECGRRGFKQSAVWQCCHGYKKHTKATFGNMQIKQRDKPLLL